MLFANKFQRSQIRLSLLMIILCLVINNAEAGRDRDRGPRCEKPDYIANGSYRMRRDRVMRITCNNGFQLQGPKTIDCVRGKWEGEKPVCAKKGCSKNLEQPENGRIQIDNEVKAILYCSDNYNLAGNRHSYCNGTHWDRPIGNCRERKNVVQHECDFETDDICGWTYEPREGLEWKRVMAANVFTTFKTGPRHDHTTLTANGGHYMLMESLTRLSDDVTLTSPIYDRALSLKTACCFQFYYFMYGAGVGDLFVIVKPVSLTLDDLLKNHKELIKFQKYGNQNNIWNEAHFNIEELEEDFQILFVAKSGRGQLSDIAIDDVKLLTGDDCRALDNKEEEEQSNEEYDSTTYESIFEMQSCAGRCFDSPGAGIIRTSGHLKGLCNCDTDCEDNETCCPDFRTICLSELFAQSTSIVDETTPKNEAVISNNTTATQTTTTSTTKKPTTTTTPSTTINTTPTTVKPTPTTIKTTPTTLKTTLITAKTIPTTVPTTTTSTTPKPKIVVTTKTTPKPTTTTTRRSTPSTTATTTRKITTKTTAKATTTTTTTTTPAPTTTQATTVTAKNSKDVITKKPIPSSKPIEYIINDKSKSENTHNGSSLLLCVFVIVAVIILAGAVYRRFGDKAVAWYMIRFKQGNGSDEDSSSIATSFKRTEANSSDIGNKSKGNMHNKMKKSSSTKNSMKTPLVNDDDDDDDEICANGNIALKNNIYTEL
ncbi:serine-rich adhesin for platelets-like [Lucilia sericata]|uniref:serine-rich adhesin for platelets-like n=1 Tax=Lucilia sericata TaxID=13632 RepID=UPI0018A838D1|nr:serine-rich adhesin for platelets-like [Lucilia sericata]